MKHQRNSSKRSSLKLDQLSALGKCLLWYVYRLLQYSPKIMHAQELLFASASRQLLAATCA